MVEEGRRCPYCGRLIPQEVSACPFCQEELAEPSPGLHFPSEAGRTQIRRGVLYMGLAAIIYYFAAGYSPLELPVAIAPMLTDWLLPLLFLGGVGLVIYGIYCRFTG